MPKASNDIDVQDGQQFTVGGVTVTAVQTPGHTPSNLSFIIPVTFRGRQHMAALWGGSGPPSDLVMKIVYRNSMTHFSNYTRQAGVDVDLSIHGDNNNFLPRLSQLTGLREEDPHPFIVGRDAYVRYEAIYYNCASAQIADMINWGYRVKLGAQEHVFPVRSGGQQAPTTDGVQWELNRRQ
jgi:metallo-beta-lactamase class B